MWMAAWKIAGFMKWCEEYVGMGATMVKGFYLAALMLVLFSSTWVFYALLLNVGYRIGAPFNYILALGYIVYLVLAVITVILVGYVRDEAVPDEDKGL